MARQLETGKYKRLKEWPKNIPPMAALKAGAGAVLLLGMAHASPDIASNLHNLPFFGGLFQASGGLTDWAPTQLGRGVTWLTEQIPQVGQHIHDIPNAILGNSVVQTGLNALPLHAGKYVRPDDLVLAEYATVGGGAYNAARWGIKRLQSAQIVDAPNGKEIQAGKDIVAALQRKNSKKYANIDPTEVAVEIKGEAGDLAKGEINPEALWARTVGLVIAPAIGALVGKKGRVWAANATINKEIYHRLPNTGLQRALNFADSPLMGLVKWLEGVGDFVDGLSNVNRFLFSGATRKKDIFGKKHGAIDSLLLDLGSAVLGSAVPLPGFTSLDPRELVELVARPELKSGDYAEKIDAASAAIVAGKVMKSPRRYSRTQRVN